LRIFILLNLAKLVSSIGKASLVFLILTTTSRLSGNTSQVPREFKRQQTRWKWHLPAKPL